MKYGMSFELIAVNNKYKYKAFLSYSHRDERFASWLQRALESYRVPRKLVGTRTGVGEVPARIRPVFRDREDLSSATDLGETIQQVLADSENLIVICSPGAAASQWVNEEIREFARLGKQDRVFCVIVDGELAGPGTPSTCFPAALAEIGMHEPLAADIRKWADGKLLSKLKLVSGMLGLPLDQLRRRDLQKRQKIWALAAVASIALAAVLIAAISARMAAQQRRDSGESLVAYKLNELRTILNVADDPAELNRMKTWDEEDLAQLVANAGIGERALINSAMELREQGIGYLNNQELGKAMEKFQDSWALLAESYRRNDNDLDTFFELGQAEYYIGFVYRDLGALEAAEVSFNAYAEITRQLIVKQPKNAEWVLEMAYSLTNLGVLQLELDANKPERALQLSQSALEYNQIALVLDPNNSLYQAELGQSHGFLADAQREVCDLEGAFQSRKKQLDLEKEQWAADKENTGRVTNLAAAYSGYNLVQEEMGQVDGAIESLEMAIQIMEPVVIQYPESKYIARITLRRKSHLMMLKALDGDIDGSWVAMQDLHQEWRNILKEDGAQDDNITNYVTFLLYKAELAQSMGDTETAIQLLGDAQNRIIRLLEKLPSNRVAGNLLMQTVFQTWELTQKMPEEAIMTKLPAYSKNEGNIRACTDASLAAKKAVMLGDMARAGELTTYLLDRGYTQVSFVHFCKAYSLCTGE
jgi:tetratricopeptide (TPR) repeat protein